jgi:hypothetical protein
MRQVIETIGTVPPGIYPPEVIDPDIRWVQGRIESIIRADRSWKVAEPLTLTVLSEVDRTYRIHCVLDTESGDIPILPGDPRPDPSTS